MEIIMFVILGLILFLIIRWAIDTSQQVWLQKLQLKELREIRKLLENQRRTPGILDHPANPVSSGTPDISERRPREERP
ncbi:hypothetical protein [Paenibacillus puerhi]|uniref:hypothetical protein n=1 Tax=Paenibacillus puerhi TaxID=2692622 RepID=UPI0013570A76|nr:hypothetical protein [Paenibacillus puerhi]